MLINLNNYSSNQNYFTLIQTIIPRPIAWVLTDNGDGGFNLAPFSFFNAVAANPPIIMLSIGWKDEKTPKDTWVNIEQRNDFVVHIPSVSHLSGVVGTSATLVHGESEINKFGIALDRVEGERLPRIKDAKIAMFCQKFMIQEIGVDQQALILGKVNTIWYSDEIVQESNGRLIIDPNILNPLTRLGGANYSSLGPLLKMNRPD